MKHPKDFDGIDRARTFSMYAPTVTVTNNQGVTVKARRAARKPTLVSVAKQASKAAIEVAKYEIAPDGKITIVTGKSEPEQMNDLDKWIAKHNAH